MKTEIKQYNMRQINLMEAKINAYLSNQISILNLSHSLYSLIRELKELPAKSFYNFVKPLSWMEGSFIRAHDENRNYFKKEELVLINEALEKIKELLSIYKQKYLSN